MVHTYSRVDTHSAEQLHALLAYITQAGDEGRTTLECARALAVDKRTIGRLLNQLYREVLIDKVIHQDRLTIWVFRPIPANGPKKKVAPEPPLDAS